MPVYGFAFNAEGNVEEVMKKMQAAIEGMGSTVTRTNNKVKDSFNKMNADASKSLNGIGDSVKKLLGGLLALEGVKSFLKLGNDAQQTAISFEVFLGSAKKADDMVAKLRNFAKVTPFESTDVNDAAKMLLNFGTAADDIMPTLQMLGDAAGGNAQRFQGMTYAFAQIQSTGRLMGQDLLQLINAGFNPLQEISKRTGAKMSDLKAAMEKGAISAAMVKEAFKSATGAGGQFYKMMEKQSQSVGGRWSTIMDEFKGKLIEAFEKLTPTINAILDGIISVMPVITNLIGNIASAFQSGPIQFFLLHLKDLLSIATKLLPVWIAYKVAMGAVNTAQQIQTVITEKLIPLFRNQTQALEGSAAAAGAFKAQLISTGIGAFAVAIGLIIEKLSAMNAEFMESIEKISRIKELAGKDKDMQSEYGKIQSAMQGDVSFWSQEQRDEMASRIKAMMKSNEDAIAFDINPSMKNIGKRINELPDQVTNAKKKNPATGNWEPVVHYTKEESKLRENMSSLLLSLKNYRSSNTALENYLQKLSYGGVSKGGPGGGGKPNPFGADTANAFNTSALAGAKGGLGEAKVINIKIDTMQKVVTSDNRQLKQRGQDAVEVMLRTVNNIAYSSSQTQ
jgi:tape measure domain-containing protein